MVSQHSARLGGHRHCGGADIFFVVEEQDSLTQTRHFYLSLKHMACLALLQEILDFLFAIPGW